MVVMKMGENDIFNRIRINAEPGERLHRTAQKRAFALFGHFRVKAGVDDKRSAAAPCHPHEVIHRHRPVVRIAADEVRAASRVTGGITDSKELVIEFGHDVSHFAARSNRRFNGPGALMTYVRIGMGRSGRHAEISIL